MTVCPSEPGVITPKDGDSARGTRIPATVTPAPDSMCWASIWRGSIRYTWSAPNTATYSGCSSCTRFSDWRIASALPRYQRGPRRCWAGTGVT
ncbi:hypothetical protein SVIOM342S_05127 [Streptomyces violaceorubidus]